MHGVSIEGGWQTQSGGRGVACTGRTLHGLKAMLQRAARA
jgi:hypothetical protein